jgi:hypothetical protein
MSEIQRPNVREQLIREATKKLLLAGADVLAGGFMSAAGLIYGAPLMGATGLLLGGPSVRKGAEDLHEGIEAIRKYQSIRDASI